MKKFISIFLLLFSCSFVFIATAQNKEIDSLKNLVANHHETDTVKIDLLNDIAFKVRFYDLNLTLQYATFADSLSNLIDYKRGKAKSLKTKALYYKEISDYPQAMKYYQSVLKICKEIEDKAITASCCNDMASLYTVQGNYPKALEYYQKSLSLCEQLDNQYYIAVINANIGDLYLKQGDNIKALSSILKAINYYEKTKPRMNLIIAYKNTVATYIEMKNDSLALSYSDKLISLCKTLGASKELTQALIARGIIQEGLKNYSLAKQHYLEAISATEKTNDIFGSWASNYSMAHLYERIGKYDLALKHALVANKKAEKLNRLKETWQTAQMLAVIYKKKKQYKQAYEYYVVFKTTADSLFNESNVKKITSLENQYKFNKEKEAIAAEQAQKDAIQSEELKHQKVVRNSFIAGFILMIVFAFVIIKNLAQKRKANRLLASQKKEIETYVEELKTTNVKLVELDTFKQGLTSMIVHDLKNPLNGILNVSKSYSAENQVRQMKQTGKQMLNMVLNILDVNKFEENQMTVYKTAVSLLAISQNAINSILFLSEQKNISITNEILPEFTVYADSEIIERVFVNILTNAIKYTPNNGNIILNTTIEKEQNFIKVNITDTGVGIPQDKLNLVFTKFGQVSAKKSGSVRSTGLGLTFCKMAVEAHGGKIDVQSETNKGTTFYFTLQATNKAVIRKPETPILTKNHKKYLLNTEEKQILTPFVNQLKKTEIYKMLELRKILRRINVESDNIKLWKEEVQKAIRSGNQEKYNELLNL